MKESEIVIPVVIDTLGRIPHIWNKCVQALIIIYINWIYQTLHLAGHVMSWDIDFEFLKNTCQRCDSFYSLYIGSHCIS